MASTNDDTTWTVQVGQPGNAFYQCHLCIDSPRLAFGPEDSVARWNGGEVDPTNIVSMNAVADARAAEAAHIATQAHIDRANDLTQRGTTLGLRPDEVAYLGDERCDCGHLYALHNSHCCTFCMVDGCDCGE